MMKLHIGCGERYLPGYRHLDEREFPHVDYIGRAEKLSAFDDNSIEEIYACHILEHFPRSEVTNVLKEWYRVICPNGLLRIAVPDFEAIAQVYSSSGDLEQVLGLLYGGQNYSGNYHFQAFYFARLKRILTQTGFHTVSRYDWHTFLPGGV